MKRTPLKRKKPLKQGSSKRGRTRSPGDFPEPVRIAASRRSGWRCEVGSSVCTGKAAHFHHRKLRSHRDQSLVNCLHVCATCHNYIHNAGISVAYMMGWLLHSWQDPAEVPVLFGENRPRRQP
jgi:hypothetical protein